jgi:hypothetical protein
MAQVIAVSPNVNGNVGSCTTNSVSTVQAANPWTTTNEVTLTNSCTGQIIQQYSYTDYSNELWTDGAIVLACIMGFGVFLWITLGICVWAFDW